MKLLLVSDQNHGGGAEAAVNRHAELFRDHGHQVTLFCCHFNPNKRLKGIHYVIAPHHYLLNCLATLKRLPALHRLMSFIEFVIRNGPLPLYNTLLNTHLCRTIERLRPDLVHVHNLPSFRRLPSASQFKIPFVLTMHNSWAICPSEQLLKGGRQPCEADCAFETPAGKSCKTHQCIENPVTEMININRFQDLYQNRPFDDFDQITAPSQSLCQLLQQSGIIPTERLCQLNNPIPSSWFHQSTSIAAPKKPYFFAAAQLFRQKGMHLLLEAFLQRPQYRLKIAGNGPEYFSLKQSIDQQNLTHVELLGWQEEPAIRALFQQATATLMPSLWFEAMGLVAIESYAFAKPVIAFDFGGIQEFVHHKKTGLVVPMGDINGLVQAMDYIAEHPEEAKAMGQAGYEFLHDTLAPKKVYEETMAVYEAARSHASQFRTTLRPKQKQTESIQSSPV